MKKVIVLLILILIMIIGGSLIYSSYYFKDKYPDTDPLKSAGYYLEHLRTPHAEMKKETYGFLPYWQTKSTDNLRLDLLSEINYFGLVAQDDGNFIDVVDGQKEPGMREWNSQEIKDLITRTHIMGGKFSVCIISHDNETTEKILDDEEAQEKLIENIIEQIQSRKLDGVNIDFEYLGEPDEEYQQKFTDFSKRLSSAIKKDAPHARMDLSIMPRAARDQDLFDFPKLVPLYDRFVGMSYNYIGGGSVAAGPTAPMTGFKDKKFYFDVETTYDDYLKYIPKEKILMGVPYYGWDWAVEEGKTALSTTLPQIEDETQPAVLSYGRAREDDDLKDNQCKFDNTAQQPWCWYTDKETKIDHQVWFEDNKSIGIKYDFANKKDLAGIAIWVLGYDKHHNDLWILMENRFSHISH